MSEATAPVQTEAPKKIKTQVSATLTEADFKRLEDYRWENRINKTSEIVAKAIPFFLDAEAAKAKGK